MLVAEVQTLEIRLGYDGSKTTYWRMRGMYPSNILVSDTYIDNCPCCSVEYGHLVFNLENGSATYKDTGKRSNNNERLFELKYADYK